MGLNAWITRMATGRAHVLVVEIPGHSLVRMRLEAGITARGWVLAHSPADADVLLVCGEAQQPFPEIIEGLWNQIPGPRCRLSVTSADAIDAALDSIPALLGDRNAQLADATGRPKPTGSGTADDETAGPPGSGAHGEHGGHGEHGDHQHHGQPESHGEGAEHPEPAEPAADQHQGSHDHSGIQHEMHGGSPEQQGHKEHGHADMDDMDMGDMHMDMSGPAGIPLASGDEGDRDGLEMDITHLSLGPVLPFWPAGLVVRCTLHGDVIGEATIDVVPSAATDAATPAMSSARAPRAVELCDAAAHLLAVAGWEPVAAKVRRLRYDLLDGPRPLGPVIAGLNRAASQVARSRTLRWSLRGVPELGGVDARSRLLGWLHTASTLLAHESVPSENPEPKFTLDEVREALTGQELATARMVIACIEPSRIDHLVGTGHG